MSEIRFVQLLTELAYLVLGIVAAAAALRRRERARVDVALLFGALGLSVVAQELPRLTGVEVVGPRAVGTLLILALPYLLLRVVDNVHDVPRAAQPVALAIGLVLGVGFLLGSGSPSAGLAIVGTVFLLVSVLYATWAFASRARETVGIMARRMWVAAAATGFLAVVFVLSLGEVLLPAERPVLSLLSQIVALLGGLLFYAAFFPPAILRQTWRLPEFFSYLRETRWKSETHEAEEDSAKREAPPDSFALDELCLHVARATGARRVVLAISDAVSGDLYLWGAPSVRVSATDGLIGQVLRTGKLTFAPIEDRADLAPGIQALFSDNAVPRAALLAPVLRNGKLLGVLAAFGDKGPVFLEDDLDVLGFFASEVAAILLERRHRAAAQELAALREADRLKDEFMAVVSHELRTPLTAITGYSDILLRKLSGPLNDRQERQVSATREAARRLLSLINDLLDVSKLQAGTLELSVMPVDLHDVIVRAVAGTRVIAASKQVSLEPAPLPAKLPPVVADEGRLQQILVNLITNAVKFTPEGGAVTVSAWQEQSPTGPLVALAVKDTGVGIASRDFSRVWERFYQADSSSTRAYGGAGLGLSIVKRLVELHRGTVEVTSPGLGRGSTFTVRLPAALSGASAGPAEINGSDAETGLAPALVHSGIADDPHRPSVLVVEDDPDIASVLSTYLENEGYRVLVATDGYQALQAAETERPFAITLDVMLPRLDGWSVLNGLKRNPATADIPVIVVSIVDNHEYGVLLGATDYLVKPIDQDRIRHVLRQVTESQPFTPASLLIVDDDPSVGAMLADALANEGWTIRTVLDGPSALRSIQEHPPSIVLLDLTMPGMDGFEVLQTLRARPETSQLPVLVLTARDLTERDRSLLVGAAQRVVLKQALRIEALREAIRAALSDQRQRTERAVRAA